MCASSRLASSGLLLLLLGCATSGESSSGSSPDTLTQADLLETNAETLYEAIQQIRPRWLRARGANLAGRTLAQVFVDGSSRGDVTALRQIRVMDVTDVRFLSIIDAATRYGTLAAIGGAILVRTGGRRSSPVTRPYRSSSRISVGPSTRPSWQSGATCGACAVFLTTVPPRGSLLITAARTLKVQAAGSTITKKEPPEPSVVVPSGTSRSQRTRRHWASAPSGRNREMLAPETGTVVVSVLSVYSNTSPSTLISHVGMISVVEPHAKRTGRASTFTMPNGLVILVPSYSLPSPAHDPPEVGVAPDTRERIAVGRARPPVGIPIDGESEHGQRTRGAPRARI